MLKQQIDSITKVPGSVTGTNVDKSQLFYSPGCSYMT